MKWKANPVKTHLKLQCTLKQSYTD